MGSGGIGERCAPARRQIDCGESGALPQQARVRAREDLVLQRLARNETLCDYEARMVCKDGSIRFVEGFGAAVVRTDSATAQEMLPL